MAILVCVKPQVQLDAISVSRSQNKFFENKPRVMSDADKVAMELAVKQGESWAIAVAPTGDVLRDAIARGAVQAHCLVTAEIDAQSVVAQLVAFCKEYQPTSIVCGCASNERGIGEVPARLAAALGWECIKLEKPCPLSPQTVFMVSPSLLAPPLPNAMRIIKSAKAQIFMHEYAKKSSDSYMRYRTYVSE